MLVFFHHCEHVYKEKWLSPLASFGHDAVIFFFLLSGFVIAHVSGQSEKNWRQYFVARLARIYSVVLPMLVVVALLYLLGLALGYPSYTSPLPGHGWISTYLASVAFLNQSDILRSELPTNAAYWSVCYEVWYYVLFGCAFYFDGWQRVGLLVVATFLAGIPILLMFPVWLMGYWFYKFHYRINLTMTTAILMVSIVMVIYLGERKLNIDDKLFEHFAQLSGGENFLNARLGFSKRFLVDYATAILLLMVIAGSFSLAQHAGSGLLRHAKIIDFLAGRSFSLYLLHMPLLAFVSPFIPSAVLAMVVILPVIYLFAGVTETRKQPYVRFFRKLLGD